MKKVILNKFTYFCLKRFHFLLKNKKIEFKNGYVKDLFFEIERNGYKIIGTKNILIFVYKNIEVRLSKDMLWDKKSCKKIKDFINEVEKSEIQEKDLLLRQIRKFQKSIYVDKTKEIKTSELLINNPFYNKNLELINKENKHIGIYKNTIRVNRYIGYDYIEKKDYRYSLSYKNKIIDGLFTKKEMPLVIKIINKEKKEIILSYKNKIFIPSANSIKEDMLPIYRDIIQALIEIGVSDDDINRALPDKIIKKMVDKKEINKKTLLLKYKK